MKKNVLLLFTVLALLLAMAMPAAATPKVVLDGRQLSFDVPPSIEKGRTLVPLRAIFEALGAEVGWDGSTRTITATSAGTEIKLVIGGQAYKNGLPVSLDVPAKIVGGRTLVPLRFVSEALGCDVKWDSPTQTITLTSGSGPNITRESARAKLAQLKIPFSEQSFIDNIIDDNLPAVNLFLAAGMNSNVKDSDGVTVLMYAVLNDNIDMVRALLTGGADVNAKDNDGIPVLMYAVDSGNTAIVKALITGGANVNLKSTDGITALMYAEEIGQDEIVKLLKSAGAK